MQNRPAGWLADSVSGKPFTRQGCAIAAGIRRTHEKSINIVADKICFGLRIGGDFDCFAICKANE